MNSEELVKNTIKKLEQISLNDIPDLDLYMDQVTTYLNNKFKDIKRHEDDKLMTKTMINNYAKSRLLPAPEKKKYSKDHVLTLAFIYFFKNVMSINDVTAVLKPLLDKYFQDGKNSLEQITEIFINYVQENSITEPLPEECLRASHLFDDLESDDQQYMQTLGTLAMLSYDVFVRKIIIEQLIDSLPDNKDNIPSKEEKSNKSTKKKEKEKGSSR